VAAVLFSLAAGCLGYLFGTAAGWHTAGPLPDDRTVVATTRLALPGQPVSAGMISRDDRLFGRPYPGGWQQDWLLGDDDDNYRPGSAEIAWQRPATRYERQWLGLVTVARSRLRHAGWRVSDVSVSHDPSGTASVTARRGHTVLAVTADSGDSENRAAVSTDFYRAPPVLVVPAGTIGAVAGGLIGWLASGWVVRRVRNRPWWYISAIVVLTALALLCWAPLILLAGHGLQELPKAFPPYTSATQVPSAPWSLLLWNVVLRPTQVGSIAVVLMLVLAGLPRELPRPTGQRSRPATPPTQPAARPTK
jgi:hypothetical protein